MYSGSGIISNCVFTGNSASLYGGGSYYATLNNCTLSGNAAKYGGGSYSGTLKNCTLSHNQANINGGGSYYGTLNNCTLSVNQSGSNGGGSYYGTLNNCTLSHNQTDSNGGGSYYGTLKNCTLSGNQSVIYGGGCYAGSMKNCVVWGNEASSTSADNYYFGSFDYSCSNPLPDGDGNIDHNPQFMDSGAGNYRLKYSSPCIDVGDTASTVGTVDLDGMARIFNNVVDMGAYESTYNNPEPTYIQIMEPPEETEMCYQDDFLAGTCSEWVVGSLMWSNSFSGASGTFSAATDWLASGVVFELGPNTIVVSGTNSSGDVTTDMITLTRTWMDGSDSPDHYVSPDGGNIWPYTNLTYAATNIQDAVDAAVAGDTVWVNDGIYDSGGAAAPDFGGSNRVCIVRDITLRSIGGPENTFIVGTGPNGSGAVRGVFMNAGVVSGFTITNGHTRLEGTLDCQRGGGVCVPVGDNDAVVSNCIITGNSSYESGAGSCRGMLYNCVISDNSTASNGGGSYFGTLYNCVLSGNVAQGSGGGSILGRLNNCTLVENLADGEGGGSYYGILKNCIVWDNTAVSGYDNVKTDGSVTFCCSEDVLSGDGNIVGDPKFMDPAAGNYRLQHTSPCIDAGDNTVVASGDVDPDGRDRIIHNIVDIGAYEYPLPSTDMTNTDESVYGEIDTCSIGGSVNEWMIGAMIWSNSATGAQGTLTPADEWSVTEISLVYGANVITVTCTNAYDGLYSQSITVTRLYEHGGVSPVHYVALDGGSVWPYTNWVDAATSIQDGVNAASAGNQVQVSGGTYSPGEEIVVVNGAVLTAVRESGMVIVDGQHEHRCFTIGNASTVEGFVIQNGGGEEKGGGVCCNGGGTLRNCLVIGCSATDGGGIYCDGGGTLEHLTVSENSADNAGGGIYCDGGGTAQNVVVYFNQAGSAYNNIYSGAFTYSCSPDLTGINNISGDPRFVDASSGNYRLRHDSPCIDAAISISGVTNDLSGNPRPVDGNLDESDAFDMGAYEYLGATADSDGDGRMDQDELATGFSPYYNEASAIAQGQAMVTDAPASYGLYTSDSIMDFSMGYLMLQTSNGWARLNLQLEKCTNLIEDAWSPAGPAVEWLRQAPENKAFYRVRGNEL